MMKTASISVVFFLVLMLAHSAAAQGMPSKIRGYKVYDAKITITNTAQAVAHNSEPDAFIKILEPTITSISLFGATVEVGAEFTANKQSGSVEFISCRDLRVNGIAVDVEEYTHPFAFKEDKIAVLPAPAKISIKTANIAKAAYKELTDSKKDWVVTGTVFVFGKFKKMGFTFKRVVPVKIDLTIKNPLR